MKKTIEEQLPPCTPLQQFFNFMKQNQYFIGNDLLYKYHELLNVEADTMQDIFYSGYDMKIKKDE